MILEQYYLGCLAQASYLIGDEESGVAVVVDPRRDVGLYLDEARARGLSIEHTILTHFHADFLAGHVELRERTGAVIHLGRRAQADFPFQPQGEGDELVLGPNVRLAFLETPGHTPEGISILVFDRRKSDAEPHAVLTGDTLFIGDVGRPDLMASIGVTADELAGMLYDSLHQKLLPLPDATILYPGHGAGSLCGKSLSTDTVSTIGAQRASNYALQAMERSEFVRILTEARPPAPAYFGYDADLNRREHGTLDAALERALAPLALETVLGRQNAGARVLDVREKDAYAAGHLAGSTNVGLDGKFATWCGSVIGADEPIMIVAEPGAEREAAMRLGRIGFDRVEGYLDGGPAAWAAHPELVKTIRRIEPDVLRARLDGADAPFVLDVRQPGEWDCSHIDGSVNVPLGQLVDRLDEVPRDRDVVVQCQTGYRSCVAISLLAARGYANLIDLRGGWEGWEALAGAVR